jgi:chitin disaccharide deacetylase
MPAVSSERKRGIIVCADDFGISPGVSRAIAELIANGRITATGCMTVMPSWRDDGRLLKSLGSAADIGLHFTLTDQSPLGRMPRTAPHDRFPSVATLVRNAIAGRLDRPEIRDELRRQIAAFEQHLGRPPDFIDGHHHIHQLPIIRSAVVEELVARRSGPIPYLRICRTPLSTLLARRVAAGRAFLIGLPGARLRRLAMRAGVPTISSFSGIYDLSDSWPYRDLMQRFLIGLEDNGLLMCHPGHVDEQLRAVDTLTDRRAHEFAYFNGPDYLEDLVEAGVELSRFRPRPTRT